VDGMVNPGERLLNAVTYNKPKMLTGLGQNGMWWVQGLTSPLAWTPTTTGGKSGPNPSGCSDGTREARRSPMRVGHRKSAQWNGGHRTLEKAKAGL
jgi:hypothetical protein